MKRLIIPVLLLALFPALLAQAGIDPDPDKIGIYFDQNADISDYHTAPLVPFFGYVILTNPSEQGITGYEFGYRFNVRPDREPEFFVLVAILPLGASNAAVNTDPLQMDFVVTLAEPLPVGNSLVLLTVQFLLTEIFPVDLYLQPAGNPGHGLGYPSYNVGNDFYGLVISGACSVSGVGGLPSAYINTYCPLPVESTSFGSVKSLYR